MTRSDRIGVLYIAPWVDLGGSDKGTIDWFANLDRRRFAPSLMTTQPAENRWLHRIEPYAEELWELPDLMRGSTMPSFILGFIEDRGIRVVHIMNSRLAFDLMPDMTNLREPPVIVVQLHAEEPDRSGYARYVSTRYGNLVDAFSVTSRQLKAALTDYDITPSRIHVIHSGVDAPGEFNPDLVEPSAALDGDGPHILWPGRFVEQKDPMLTLEVIERLTRRRAAFTLHMLGDGHLKPALQRRAAELGVAERIRWHPPSHEMSRWYRGADVLLMTSVFEGVPYVIYEALAMGVPVVAPALPGNREFMDADSGVLVDPRDDVDQYADALARMLGDAELRRRSGERSRERMLGEFSLREMAARHERLYEHLLERRPASVARGFLPDLADEDATDGGEPLRLPRTPPPARTVGVLVPCYRHGLFLRECLDSVQAQTLQAARVIVIDDGSDDPETIEALEAVEREQLADVIRLPANGGPSAARNRGLTELRTSYVLPLDADDKLLPDALERMVMQLEAAPPDVGFIYPNALHFGNRHDYVPSPPYNLHLLLQSNYCPATSLFDRRLFEAGVSYPESVVFGHEDWDLVLQLAERGIVGQVADGPTFLYRRRGFSRVNAVEYGPDAFDEVIARRHRRLFGARRRIKAEWAPALTIVLSPEQRTAWRDADLSGLARQTCADFRVIAPPGAELPDGVSTTVLDERDDAGEWLAEALAVARGRWILFARPAVAPLTSRPTFVEQLLLSFWDNGTLSAVALALAPDPGASRLGFRRLAQEQLTDAEPVAVAWSRPPWGDEIAVDVGASGDLVTDLVLGLQALGPLQWRNVPTPRPVASGSPSPVMEAHA